MALTKELIARARDGNLTRVEIPEWADDDGTPGVIYLRVMSGVDREAMEREWTATEGIINKAREKLLVKTVCDENGERLFGDTDDDLAMLGTRNSDVLARLFTQSMKLNKLDKDSVENAAKN
jgi:hypothetical protein